MDFDFKWWVIGFGVFCVFGFGYDSFKEYNKTKIELAKIQSGNCGNK